MTFSPDEMRAKIAAIWTTKRGAIIIECSEARRLAEAISAAVGESVKTIYLKTFSAPTTVEVLDLDEAVEGQGVVEVIAGVTDCLPNAVRVHYLIEYGETKSAVLILLSTTALNLLAMKRIVVGWTIARVRPRVEVSRYFKCHRFEHVAADCSARVDRKGQCWRYGGDGHSYMRV